MLGPREPNLYKDLSQGTVTKGIQIKIFFPQKKFLKKNLFFFENLDLDPDAHPDVKSGSGSSSGSRSRFSKKNFFLNFYFSLCRYYEILTNLPLNKSQGPYTTK